MGHTLSIGAYDCDPDAAWFQIDRYGIVGQTGRINKTRHIWTIWGRVNGAGASAVDAEVTGLENAVVDGIDLVFDLGSTMQLLSSGCYGGTHIKSFSWLPGYDGVRGSGAEGILRRTFKLVVYGDVLATTDTDVTYWHETLRQIGNGGPRVLPVGSLLGDIQAQQVQAKTPFYLIQSGFALGLTSRPNAPAGVYYGTPGVYYMPEQSFVEKVTPKDWGKNRNTQYGIRWSYKCWAIGSLLGGASIDTPF